MFKLKIWYNTYILLAFAIKLFVLAVRIVSKRCCFAGHSKIYDDFQEKLKAEIENLIKNKDVKEFWAGNYGDFDYTAAKIIKELKKEDDLIDINIFRSFHRVNLDTIIGYHKKGDEHFFLDHYDEL